MMEIYDELKKRVYWVLKGIAVVYVVAFILILVHALS